MACFEAGKKYLEGLTGFPRHVQLGLEYLRQAESVREEDAQRLIVDSLDLHEIAAHDRIATLERAARAGRPVAQLKLGVWYCLSKVRLKESTAWLLRAAAAGELAAQKVLTLASGDESDEEAAMARLKALLGVPGMGGPELLVLAMDRALANKEPQLVFRSLAVSLAMGAESRTDLADRVYAALDYAAGLPQADLTVDQKTVELLLDDCVSRGNAGAALMLGQALSGRGVGGLKWNVLVGSQNRRKASALLMRAADAGHLEAWVRLYELHENHHSSVANPPMARFYLEKAAMGGDVLSQRRLGAAILRTSSSLRESEDGLNWLFTAAQAQDHHAQALLRTFVIPAQGDDAEAARGIAAIGHSNPGLASRLSVARSFGLTKLEALTVDLLDGLRPWGLVVGKNPFIQHVRLSSPRAIPALSIPILQELRRSAAQASIAGHATALRDADLRQRGAKLKKILEVHDLPESLFFAKANSEDIDVLRGGGRWAKGVKGQLDAAMEHADDDC